MNKTVLKGTKAIGKVSENAYIQVKHYPKHFIFKDGGFGVSLDLLNMLDTNHVETLIARIEKGTGKNKVVLDTIKENVHELIEGKKIQYAGFDEQRLLKWNPKRKSKLNNVANKRGKKNG